MVNCPRCGHTTTETTAEKRPPNHAQAITIILCGLLLFCGAIALYTVLDPVTRAQFERIGYHKKASQGSYLRVFSIYTPGEDWSAMAKYAKSQMWSEGGVTGVLFFDNRENTPDVTFVGREYPERYDSFLVAVYYRWQDGSEQFTRVRKKNQ